MTSQRTLHIIYIYMSDCPHAVLLLKFETLKNNKATSKNQIQQETPSTIWILDSTSLSSSLLFMLPSTFPVCTQFKDLSSVGSGNWLAPEGKGLSSFSKTFLGFDLKQKASWLFRIQYIGDDKLGTCGGLQPLSGSLLNNQYKGKYEGLFRCSCGVIFQKFPN